MDKNTENIVEAGAENAVENTAERPEENTAESTEEGIAEDTTGKTEESIAENTTENTAEKIAEEVVENIAKEITQENAEETVEAPVEVTEEEAVKEAVEETVEETAVESPGKKRAGKIAAVCVSAAVLLFAGLYLTGAFYFKSHFFPDTTINGRSVGWMTDEAAEEKIEHWVESYVLTITNRDGESCYITGKDIDCAYESDGAVSDLLDKQNYLGWIASVFKSYDGEIAVSVSCDESLLAEAVESLEWFNEDNIIEPENAQIILGEDGYEIQSEVMGTQMIYENVFAKVEKAVQSGETTVKLTDDDYVNPEYKSDSDEVTKATAQIEKYLNVVITYDVMGSEDTLDKSQIIKFIQVDDDFLVTLDDDSIAVYVQSLASKYNTYADVRSFKTSDGDTIEIGGGDYGWIVDKPGEAEQIKEDLETGISVTRELVYSQRAFAEGEDDIGNTYIEIDYTNQHLWYYEDGELVADCDIVSGNINRGNGSPDGVFKIVYKQSPAVLRGEDYESNVTYFMPFAYNVGIHDASWRNGKFGGEIYKTNGSHGCVNVPYDTAEAIYESVKVGTPVIAYYRDEVKLTSESANISNAYSYAGEDD